MYVLVRILIGEFYITQVSVMFVINPGFCYYHLKEYSVTVCYFLINAALCKVKVAKAIYIKQVFLFRNDHPCDPRLCTYYIIHHIKLWSNKLQNRKKNIYDNIMVKKNVFIYFSKRKRSLFIYAIHTII